MGSCRLCRAESYGNSSSSDFPVPGWQRGKRFEPAFPGLVRPPRTRKHCVRNNCDQYRPTGRPLHDYRRGLHGILEPDRPRPVGQSSCEMAGSKGIRGGYLGTLLVIDLKYFDMPHLF